MEFDYLSIYLDKINSGEIVTSKRVKKIYQKLVDELEDKNSSYKYVSERAMRVIKFIEAFCKHSKGEWAGKPVKLELFQKAFICALFGIVDKETGLRRFKQAFFMVGRKNGKSTMLAGIALYMMIADGEAGAEVYSLATKLDQASIIYEDVIRMVKQSPNLNKHIKKRRTHLEFASSNSKLKPLATDSRTLDGLNSNCTIIDELHAIKDKNLYEVMLQSMSTRREPLLIMITTAGYVRESVFDDIYNYSTNVIDGTFKDETILPVIYELDEKDEWDKEECWLKANPGLGTIKKKKDLVDKVNRAKQNVSDLNGLLTKDFNIRETAYHAWLNFEDIDGNGYFNIEDFKGKWFIGGVDLSQVNDLTCATALLMDSKTENIFVEQMYWIPKDSLEEHLKTDKVPYDIWRNKGFLRVCDSPTINYSDVTEWFKSLVYEKDISPLIIYYDRYNASYWVQEMEQLGFRMKACAQGAITFSTPMKHLEANLKAKKIIYNENPILKWCLSNTDIEIDKNENIRPIKGGNRFMRIDGTVALINAYVGLIDNYQEFREING